MIELMFAFVIMTLIILAMSVGVIVTRKPIKGSCGGIAALGMDTSCDICGGDTSKCDEENSQQTQGTNLAYEVSENR